ncbi:hypothetical protein MNBD_NITROSPINAE02-1578 [hydrothermal vent metagenome]|uniref:SHS2 domain-containing protein n=1 Tax=hydrothermal vent metagenome TaxID=652676 RepID=A0A3B1BLS2_9ZZZZ
MSINVFGIDIGADKLKVAVVEKGFRGYEIVRLTTRKISGMDDADVSETLASVIDELGFDNDKDQVAALYPARKLSSRTMDIPLVQRRKILEALPYEIESQSPFGVDDFVSDFISVETRDTGSKIFAVIALKTDFEKFLEVFFGAGLDPDLVIPEPLALTAVFMGEDAMESLSVIIDIGGDTTVMTALQGGKPVSFHVFTQGLRRICLEAGEEESQMEHAMERRWSPGSGGDIWEAPIKKFASALALESKRLIMSTGRQMEEARDVEIILCGGGGDSERLAKAIADETGEKVKRLTLPVKDATIDDAKISARKPPATIFAGAIGAALRIAEREKYEPVNLRTGGFEKKRRFAGDRNQAIVAGVFLAVALLISFSSFIIEGYRLGNRYESLKNEIRAEFKKALPEVKRIVAESQQLKNALAQLDEKSRALGPALLDRDVFLGRLLDISRASPKDIRLDVEELVYEWGQMTISGRTESFEKVEMLKNNIAKLPWAKSVVVDKAKAAPAAGAISFRLEIKTI